MLTHAISYGHFTCRAADGQPSPRPCCTRAVQPVLSASGSRNQACPDGLNTLRAVVRSTPLQVVSGQHRECALGRRCCREACSQRENGKSGLADGSTVVGTHDYNLQCGAYRLPSGNKKSGGHRAVAVLAVGSTRFFIPALPHPERRVRITTNFGPPALPADCDPSSNDPETGRQTDGDGYR